MTEQFWFPLRFDLLCCNILWAPGLHAENICYSFGSELVHLKYILKFRNKCTKSNIGDIMCISYVYHKHIICISYAYHVHIICNFKFNQNFKIEISEIYLLFYSFFMDSNEWVKSSDRARLYVSGYGGNGAYFEDFHGETADGWPFLRQSS